MDTLVRIDLLRLEKMNNNAVDAVVLYAYLENCANFFEGPVIVSCKSLSKRLYNGDEGYANFVGNTLLWLEDHGYVELRGMENSTKSFAVVVLGKEFEIWDEFEKEEVERLQQKQEKEVV